MKMVPIDEVDVHVVFVVEPADFVEADPVPRVMGRETASSLLRAGANMLLFDAGADVMSAQPGGLRPNVHSRWCSGFSGRACLLFEEANLS